MASSSSSGSREQATAAQKMMQYTTMSITSMGASTLPDQKRPPRPFVIKDTNRVDDIDGARSKVPYADRYSNKPPTSSADVAGSVSRPLTHSRNVRDLSLFIDDIDGTRHSIKDRMMRTKRHVNPLVPEYDLPSFVPARVPESTFLRDSMNTDDVDGSSAKPLQKFQVRDNISTDDIVGAQACWRPAYRRARLESEPHDIMSIGGDIVLRKSRFQDRGQRSTDLMNPVYAVNGIVVMDEPRYTKPRPLKKYIPDNHLLDTRDIDGATSGWGRLERKEYRNIMTTMDVEGAQADTIKHSIRSNRLTNPLTPVYQSLEGDALPPLLAPLLPHHIVAVPTLKPQSQSSQSSQSQSSAQTRPRSQQPVDTGSGRGAFNGSEPLSTVASSSSSSSSSGRPPVVDKLEFKFQHGHAADGPAYSSNQNSERRDEASVSGGRYRRLSGSAISPAVSARARHAALEREQEIAAVRHL